MFATMPGRIGKMRSHGNAHDPTIFSLSLLYQAFLDEIYTCQFESALFNRCEIA
jgi:hypothetical protein